MSQTTQQRFVVNGRKHDLRCESAKHQNCKCGCGGKYHGAKSGHVAKDKETGLPKYRIDGEVYYVGVAEEMDWSINALNGIETVPLNLRLDIVNHSPTGFAWGYYGSGPAQTALAILADALGNNDELAEQLHQTFKAEKIATIPKESNFKMSRHEVIEWIQVQQLKKETQTEAAS